MKAHQVSFCHKSASFLITELGITYIDENKSLVNSAIQCSMKISCPECHAFFDDIHTCAYHHKTVHFSEHGKYMISSVKKPTHDLAFSRNACKSCDMFFGSTKALVKHWKQQPDHNPLRRLKGMRCDDGAIFCYQCNYTRKNRCCRQTYKDPLKCIDHCMFKHNAHVVRCSVLRLCAQRESKIMLPNKYDVDLEDNSKFELDKLKTLSKYMKKNGDGFRARQRIKRLITNHKQFLKSISY